MLFSEVGGEYSEEEYDPLEPLEPLDPLEPLEPLDEDEEDDEVVVWFVYARAACARSQTFLLTSASHAVSRMQALSWTLNAGSTELVEVVPQPLERS